MFFFDAILNVRGFFDRGSRLANRGHEVLIIHIGLHDIIKGSGTQCFLGISESLVAGQYDKLDVRGYIFDALQKLKTVHSRHYHI